METKTPNSSGEQILATDFNISTINEIRAFKNRTLYNRENKELDIDGAILTETSLDFIADIQAGENKGVMIECERLDEILKIIKDARREYLSDSGFIEIMDHLDWIRDIFIKFTNPLCL